MRNVLLTWNGEKDLAAARGTLGGEPGPVLRALLNRPFDEVVVLSNYTLDVEDRYGSWLRSRQAGTSITIRHAGLPSGPTNFTEVYQAAVAACESVLAGRRSEVRLVFHLSPGTAAMAAVWAILAKTRFPAELIESSREHGVVTVEFPFDMAARFIPDGGFVMGHLASGKVFEDIVAESPQMARVITRCRRAAMVPVPVLIQGESGTGKELLAQATHKAGPRAKAPFIAINCGAIPADTVESELFGHEPGAFTSADKVRIGHFEQADGGTVFLDEIGELPLAAQAKLLRVLQEGEVTRLGSSAPHKVNVRIIAATNRKLVEEVKAGRFREDLLYRLAYLVIEVPPLRHRPEDLGRLIDRVFEGIKKDARKHGNEEQKVLSESGKRRLMGHSWPGNVRELINTLWRAFVWSEGDTISEEDIGQALLSSTANGEEALNNPIHDLLLPLTDDGVDVDTIVKNVKRHYARLARAAWPDDNATAAAKIGYSVRGYQNLLDDD